MGAQLLARAQVGSKNIYIMSTLSGLNEQRLSMNHRKPYINQKEFILVSIRFRHMPPIPNMEKQDEEHRLGVVPALSLTSCCVAVGKSCPSLAGPDQQFANLAVIQTSGRGSFYCENFLRQGQKRIGDKLPGDSDAGSLTRSAAGVSEPLD